MKTEEISMPALRSAAYKDEYDRERAKFPGLLKNKTVQMDTEITYNELIFFLKEAAEKQDIMVSIQRAKSTGGGNILRKAREKKILLC